MKTHKQGYITGSEEPPANVQRVKGGETDPVSQA